MILGEAVVYIRANMAQLTAGLGKAQVATNLAVGKMTAGMAKYQTQIKAVGKSMALAGGIVTAAFALTVRAAISFEEELAQVSTMLDKSAMDIMPKYKDALQAMSVEFGEGTATLTKGLYDILSASIPPAEALDVLAISAKAAVAGITDTGTAADAITTILNSYGFEASEAGRVSDQLFAIVKGGKITFNELAPAIGRAAATSNMAGLSFEDLGASISTITRAGISSNQAMTAVVGILKTFLTPMDEAIDVAEGFGLVLNTTTLKTIGLTGVMEKLKDASAEQLAAIFGNIRGLKGIAAALGDVEGYARDLERMYNSLGLTQDAFDKQSAAVGFQLKRLKQSFNAIAVVIGDILLPHVMSIVEWAIKATMEFKRWAEANKPLIGALVKIGAVLGVLALTGGIIMMAVGAFLKLKIILVAVAGAIKTVTLLMMTNPLGLALGAIAALYTLWMTNFAGIRDFTNAVIKSIVDSLGWLADGVMWVLEKLGLYKSKQDEIVTDSVKTEDAIKKQGDLYRQVAEGIITAEEALDEYKKTTEEIKDVNAELGTEIGNLTDEAKKLYEQIAAGDITFEEAQEMMEEFGISAKEAGEIAGEAAEGVGDLTEGMEGLEAQTDGAKTALQEFGEKVETFDEWVQRLADETAEANSKMADEAEEAYERYADAMLPIEERLYELSHTEEEVAARKLALEREKAEATIRGAELSAEKQKEELTKVREWYEAEIALIIVVLEEKKQKEIEAAEATEDTAAIQQRAVGKITEEWDDLITKVDVYKVAMENLAKVVAEQALEALPTIEESGYKPDYLPEGEGTPIEGFAAGTPYIKKTGIVKVHEGEAILPKKVNPFSKMASSNVFNNQRSDSKTFSPNIWVTVQGDGDPQEIKKAIEKGLTESTREFGRSGSWLMPGIA